MSHSGADIVLTRAGFSDSAQCVGSSDVPGEQVVEGVGFEPT